MNGNKKKWLSIILMVVLIIGTIQMPSVKAFSKNSIQLSYSFEPMQLSKGINGTNVKIEGLSAYNETGMPDLPSKTVKVLLPQGTTVKTIKVASKGEQISKDVLVQPAGSVEAIGETAFVEKVEYNASIYKGNQQYPETKFTEGRINDTRGFTVFTMVLYPVVYQNKNLYYTSNMQVELELEKATHAQDYTPVQGDEEFLSEDIENKTAINSYFNGYHSMDIPVTGTGLLGNGVVDYVIITNSALAPTFQSLADYKATKGLICAVVKTEDIYGKYTGRDKAEKVRSFLKEAYQVNKVRYVLLGGDGDNSADSESAIVPTRLFYSESIESTEMPLIASDAYYGCLQGDYDFNTNGIFGETKDGEKGGDVDLTYDVYVGRAPVDDVREAENFINKTINYETSIKSPTALMVGEQLQGNYSCSVELAAATTSTLSRDSLSDNLKNLRDKSVKEEYTQLYYKNNAFMKSIFTSDIGLLADFSSILLKYYKPIKNYLNDKDSYNLSEEDAIKLKEFCDSLEREVRTSKTECDDKGKIADILHDMGQYIEKNVNQSLTNIIENSEYYSTDIKPLEGDIFGGDYKDQIRYGSSENDITTKGVPTSYQISTLYDRDSSNKEWDKSQVVSALNDSPQLVNHLGHANTDNLMKLSIEEIKGLSNTSAFFYYSQGCFPGSFDNMQVDNTYSNADSIAEELVVSNKISGAFAAVVNSRYGWYDGEGTKGPSQVFDRWFWDGIFTQEHTNMGRLISYSKEKMLDKFTDPDHGTVLRFCFYTINLLGDPETELTKTVQMAGNVTIPQQLKAVQTSTGASLTWNSVVDAVNYQVYQYDFDIKDYVKLGDSTSPLFVVNNLKWGNNIFAVRGVNIAGTISGYSNQVVLDNTLINKFELKQKGKYINLSWEALILGDGYYIYRATSKNGKYKKIGTISKNATTSYKDKTVRKKQKYYYKVCAYKSVDNVKLIGKYTTIESVKIK